MHSAIPTPESTSRVPSKDSEAQSKPSRVLLRKPSFIARSSTNDELHRVTGSRKVSISSTLDEVPEDVDRLLKLLVERGRGSLLRGWRRELDPTGSLEVSFQDFCRAAKRMGYVGDPYKVFGLDDDLTSLSLAELAPGCEKLFKRFRDWAKEMFGGLAETFSALDSTGRGKVTADMFLDACERQGFEATESELLEIFKGLDVNFSKEVSPEDVIWLEPDRNVRELAAYNSRKNQKDKHLRLMAWAYTEDGRLNLPPCHRKSQRPWLSVNFDEMPMLINQKRVEWQRTTYKRSLKARITFVRHLRNTYGNEIRAWRIGLDPEDAFEIDDKVIRRYCRKADLRLDTAMLWKSLDKDCDGMFRLEELSVRAADVLASFQDWACETCGSCADIWDLPQFVEARRKPQGEKRWMSEKKVLFSAFAELLKELDCPFYHEPTVRSLLLASLDKYGCGFISRSDLEWLDKWEPPEWLCAEPDHAAWNELREMLMRIYQHPLKAWRNLLDADNSNNVSWVEFKQACEKLRFKGNVGGAWRVLNEHLSSSISMKEYDAASADLLGTFKEWADTNFGSVKLAFKALETDGRLSYPDLRRACQKLKYTGEVRLLFDCLDMGGQPAEGGKRFISLKEVSFLDDWEGDASPEEQAEDEVVNAILEEEAQKASLRMLTSSSLPALPARLLELSKSKQASPLLSGSSSYRSGEGIYTNGGGSTSRASQLTKCSSMSDRERVHRTYHCLGKSKQGQRHSGPNVRLQVLPSLRAGPRSRSQGSSPKKLPWLTKILCIDDEMRANSGQLDEKPRSQT